jgi:hypothetical protein
MTGIRQIITASGGFAYGAIDGDLYTVGPPRNRYLLAPWRPPAPHPLAPSLPAVDYGDLSTWRNRPANLALRWLHGGREARSAMRDAFAASCHADRWQVVEVSRIGPGDPTPAVEPIPDDAVPAGILLLVDEAGSWPLRELTWLLSNALFHQPHRPARVLFGADTLDAWPALRASLAHLQARDSAQRAPSR